MNPDMIEKVRDLVDQLAKDLENEDLRSRHEWMALDNLKAAGRQLHSAFACLYVDQHPKEDG